MQKKKSFLTKICACLLAVATVATSLLPNGFVFADGNPDTAPPEIQTSKILFKLPNEGGEIKVNTSEKDTLILTVREDGKTYVTDKDDNTSEVTVTKEGYSLEIEKEAGETISIETIPHDGYEVATYRTLSDSGEEIENIDTTNLSPTDKKEVTFTNETQIIEMVFKAVETTKTESEIPEKSTEESVIPEEIETTSTETEVKESKEDVSTVTEENFYPEYTKPWNEVDWSKFNADIETYENTLDMYDIEFKDNYGESFAEKLEEKELKQKYYRANADDYPIGKVLSGSADVQAASHSGGVSYFTLGNFRGGLGGLELQGSAWCANHTAALPYVGMAQVSCTATVSKVDKVNGYVYFSGIWTPVGATDGHTSNENGLIGYQRIGFNARLKVDVSGKLAIQKTSANSNWTSGNGYYSLYLRNYPLLKQIL